MYISSRILLCDDESPILGQLMKMMSTLMYTVFCKCSLVLNCGFARVATYDSSSSVSCGHQHSDILDKAARLDHFLKLSEPSNVLPSLLSLNDGK